MSFHGFYLCFIEMLTVFENTLLVPYDSISFKQTKNYQFFRSFGYDFVRLELFPQIAGKKCDFAKKNKIDLYKLIIILIC